MTKFETIFGEELDVDCMGCVVADASKFKQGRIFQTELFDISQDFELAVPGMMVISPMRHINMIESLTEDEVAELGLLTIECKRALVDLWEQEKVFYCLYEDGHQHIHLVIVPLWKDLKIKNRYAAVAELSERKNELKSDVDNMRQVTEYIEKLREWFAQRLG